jgi:dnd system-associated protein 4
MRDTVAIEKSVHALYQELTEGTDPVNTPFRTMKDVFMWAMLLGVRVGERKPLERREVIFRWGQFSSETDVPLIKAVSLATDDDVAVLASRDAMLTSAEEFANVGIHVLYGTLTSEPGRALWNLIPLLGLPNQNETR